jgi:hypothetical protein
MSQDKNTAGYQMRVRVEFVEVNRYGDELNNDGNLTFTKTIAVKTLTELARVLARLEKVSAEPARTGARP